MFDIKRYKNNFRTIKMIKIIFFKKNIKYFSEMLDKFWETCIIAKVITNGRLAQLGEHLPYKQRVGGSIPSTSIFFFFTKNIIKTSRLG